MEPTALVCGSIFYIITTISRVLYGIFIQYIGNIYTLCFTCFEHGERDRNTQNCCRYRKQGY